MNWVLSDPEAIRSGTHISTPPSNGGSIYKIETTQALKAQVNYMKK